MIRAISAVASLVAFVALGNIVSHRAPAEFDLGAHALFYGRGVPLAVVFTQLGRLPAYVALCVAGLILGFVRRAWLVPSIVSIVVLLAAWFVSDLYKGHFARPRPEGQLVFHEPTFSFASGHATLALTFYGGWALYAWNADLPRGVRTGLVVAALLVVAGISWSRLALGAHYLTDVIGGWLLGITFVMVHSDRVARVPDRSPDPFAR